MNMDQSSQLRFVTRRLNNTPVKELPRISGFLASSLTKCADILKSSDSTAEESVLVHKLKTRISSLLQDRTAEGRVSGAILVKALVENGESAVLASSESWVRSLLAGLNKSDTVEIKKIYIITISRIFSLSKGNSSLQREIAIPHITAFINSCLTLAKPISTNDLKESQTVASPLLQTIFHAFHEQLQIYFSTFRPFVLRIRNLCLSILEQGDVNIATYLIGLRVFSSLHTCAPKNGAPQEWAQTCSNVIQAAHDTSKLVFRAIKEDWASNDAHRLRDTIRQDYKNTLRKPDRDELGLGPWEGIYSGISRLVTYLNILQSHVSCRTASPVEIPIGSILDLLERFVSAGFTLGMTREKSSTQLNPEVGNDEVDELFLTLPRLYCSCLSLMQSIITTYRESVLSVYSAVGHQILGIFQIGKSDELLRSILYDTFRELIGTNSQAASQLDEEVVISILGQASKDLMDWRNNQQQVYQTGHQDEQKKNSTDIKIPFMKSFPQLSNAVQEDRTGMPNICRAAWSLLPVILAQMPTGIVPHSIRTELDRVAILCDHTEAMYASVTNPQTNQNNRPVSASVIPFLAQSDLKSVVLESLLRPRMPLVGVQLTDTNIESVQNGDYDTNDSRSNTQNGTKEDLLSRLESSLNDDEELGDTHIGIQDDHHVLSENHMQLEEDLVSKKRSHAIMQDTAVAESATQSSSILANEAKKQRAQDMENRDEGVSYMTASDSGIKTSLAVVDLQSKEHLSSAPSSFDSPGITIHDEIKSAPAKTLQTSNKSPVYDDSSDFEIPEINLESDTEDDDDIEDV